MKLAIACLVTLSLVGCVDTNQPSVEDRGREDTPHAEYIGQTGIGYLSRFFDNEQGNVCYMYRQSISCVPMQVQVK